MSEDTKSLRVLTFPDLAAKGIKWSRIHIHRLINRGEFPACFRLGSNTLAWKESEIDAWILDRINGGNVPSPKVQAVARKAAKASAAVRKAKGKGGGLPRAKAS